MPRLLQIQNDFEEIQYFGPVQKVLSCMTLKQFKGKIHLSEKTFFVRSKTIWTDPKQFGLVQNCVSTKN